MEKTLTHLNSILETVACPFCGHEAAKSFTEALPDMESRFDESDPLQSIEFQFHQCCECQTVYLKTKPVPEEIWKFYSHQYHCYESFEERGVIFNFLSQMILKRKIKLFESYLVSDNPKILDYGCGSGTWMQMMKQRGINWDFMGVDIVPEQVEKLKQHGIEAYACDELNIEKYIADDSVDLVHLFHVIEHVPNPLYLLKKLYCLLKPGGVIIGQTPNWNCAEQKRYRTFWNQWHFPRHLVVFSEETLAKHALEAGLKVVQIRSSLSAATQWAASLLKKRAFEKKKPYLSTKEPLYPWLTLLALPITILQILAGRNTSHMDFILRKPKS